MALEAKGVAFTPHAYEHQDTATNFGEEAAAALGLDENRVFKTLIVQADAELVVAVVPVSGKLDVKALATLVGAKKATLADPALAARRTGYIVGGISPIGQKTALTTIVDESAELYDTVFVSGGRRGFDIELAPRDLAELTGARFAAIARA
ncbi:Cys-tRNA(Pro)/Cys-tRNA(Cys) deacylase [Frondihabitans sucicola]|uniref:Cys-tRNA(Pro)/Cys-tRNA(Cys) deacylase n=1 Tax=Frondihabitans sucicola TaxID=1268041 RepID=A0ABM8GS67_9MICO|nr:Cys-tRNA(Pro)/Cys-tRNA(Cys) deacylase [Frondihabitans sucicola]